NHPRHPRKELHSENQRIHDHKRIPLAPQDLEILLSEEGSAVELSWENVQCSTGFKVYRSLRDGSEESFITSELTYRFEDLLPCEIYSFALATLVDEQESEPSEQTRLAIPPR
ncbi:Fibronectinlike, partial [Caligus rogercresseyi]